jgi:hypothetical protein
MQLQYTYKYNTNTIHIQLQYKHNTDTITVQNTNTITNAITIQINYKYNTHTYTILCIRWFNFYWSIFKFCVCLPWGWCDVTPKHVGSLITYATLYFSIVYQLAVVHVVAISRYTHGMDNFKFRTALQSTGVVCSVTSGVAVRVILNKQCRLDVHCADQSLFLSGLQISCRPGAPQDVTLRYSESWINSCLIMFTTWTDNLKPTLMIEQKPALLRVHVYTFLTHVQSYKKLLTSVPFSEKKKVQLSDKTLHATSRLKEFQVLHRFLTRNFNF